MTKLDLVLARLRQLPPDRQEAIAKEIEFRLDHEPHDSVFSDDEWAEIEATMQAGDESIPHEDVAAALRARFP